MGEHQTRVAGRWCCHGCQDRATEKARVIAAGDQVVAAVQHRITSGWARSLDSVETAVARQLVQLRVALRDRDATGDAGWVAGEAEMLAALCGLWAALLRARN